MRHIYVSDASVSSCIKVALFALAHYANNPPEEGSTISITNSYPYRRKRNAEGIYKCASFGTKKDSTIMVLKYILYKYTHMRLNIYD